MKESANIHLALTMAFENAIDPAKKYVIAIQGVSGSGKTTFADNLRSVLIRKCQKNRKVVKLSTDDFYRDNPYKGLSPKEKENYDFDNPDAIDWEAMKRCFRSYLQDEEFYITSHYDFKTKRRTEKIGPATDFNIIIVEGLFAHNLFSDKIFNIEEYDRLNTKKPISVPYVHNSYLTEFSSKIKILKILFNLSEEEIIKERQRHEAKRTCRGDEYAIRYYHEFVKPSNEKWVISPKVKRDCHILLENGTRSPDLCNEVFMSITNFFEAEVGDDYFMRILEDLSKIEA